ncbi:MAG TPA: hypothetical protein VGN18_06405 [Jatrophihabitans sp.]|jgi:hypothetical protein|uniref:hypothetical protein n=1 Tax=Jatrophihabitans sp. TaxID=1932789 RepID=UPI002E031863|nr:hypothetical protein [Jatrophihabitans sp.]
MGHIWVAVVVAAGTAFGAAACSHSASRTAPLPAPTVRVSGSRVLTGAELAYGAGVGPIPGAVFRPGVVVIGGGANSVRGADSSGLVWTIAGSAPGASRLAVGSIMAATSFATGRVVALTRVGGDDRVVLAPVALTDVFSELDLGSGAPIALDHPLAYAYAGAPAVSAARTDDTRAGPPPTAAGVAPTAPPLPRFVDLPTPTGLPPSGAASVPLAAPTLTPTPIKEGDFTLTPYCCSPSAGVRIAYSSAAGRMVGTLGLSLSRPTVEFHLAIHAGALVDATFKLHGAGAVSFSFDAATTDVSGNFKSPVLRVPVALTIPLAGVPFTVKLEQSLYASVQLAGQAAFSASGSYGITGDLGFGLRGGSFGADTPTFRTTTSALKDARSLAVGINAATLGYGARLSAGIGVLGFTGGPYVDLGASLAIAKDGSPTPTSLTAGCVTAAVYVQGSYGVGYTVPEVVASLVNAFLSLFNARPIAASGGKNWGPYTLWNPPRAQLCLQRK